MQVPGALNSRGGAQRVTNGQPQQCTTVPVAKDKCVEHSFDSIAIGRNLCHGSAAGKMGDASDTQERPMSGGPIAQPIRPGRFSKIMASPSRSGQGGVGIGCQPLTMISFFAISEPGRSTVEPSARMQMASISESTALHSGIRQRVKFWLGDSQLKGESSLSPENNYFSQKTGREPTSRVQAHRSFSPLLRVWSRPRGSPFQKRLALGAGGLVRRSQKHPRLTAIERQPQEIPISLIPAPRSISRLVPITVREQSGRLGCNSSKGYPNRL